MKFGPLPVFEAVGAHAAHAVAAGDVRLRKGEQVTEAVADRLAAAGISRLTVFSLEAGDVAEDEAAARIAAACAGEGLEVRPPFTGRANLHATGAGLLLVDRPTIDAMNEVGEALTVATLPPWRAVIRGEMVATVKVIPYAVPSVLLDQAISLFGTRGRPLRVTPYRIRRVGAVSTIVPGLKTSLVRKTLDVLAHRLAPTGAAVETHAAVSHDETALAAELDRQVASGIELAVVFGGSAIADRRDVVPAAIEACGGRIEHFGMPVDPGNLLLVGSIGGVPVIGAPGCARSPRENGFDWVLARLLAGIPVASRDIGRLGVGGLLVETKARGQPRSGEAANDATFP